MGKTADLYKKLLCQELWETEYNTKLENYKGELITVSDQDMQDAIRKVQKKIDRLVPNKKKAKRNFLSFCDDQEDHKGAVHDAESKKRYGDGIKFQQYQKNKDALVKQAAETLRREIAWNNTLVQCGLNVDQAKKMVDGNARWMKLLMRTGTNNESLAYNEKIVTLLAFGRKQITEEEFVSKRVSQCTKYENMSNEDARTIVEQEKKSVGDVLWDEVRQVADLSRRDTENQAFYATMVLTGKAGKNKKPSLDRCYKSLGSASTAMCLDLEFCLESVKEMDGFTNEGEKKKFVSDIQFQTLHDHTTGDYLDFAANPYFCVVDPFKMNAAIDRTGNKLHNVLPNGKEATVGEELNEALVHECNQIHSNLSNLQRKALAPFGLGIDDKVEYRTNDRSVYKDADGHVCIIRQLKLDERGPMVVDAFHPEDLVDAGMKPELDGFLHTCKKWNRKHYTSDQFENMRTALEELAEPDKVGCVPRKYDMQRLENQLKRLQETSKLYLDKKKSESTNGRYKRGYETRRVNFATKLNQFAGRKLKELGYVKEHMVTLEDSRKAERDYKEDKSFIEIKKDPKYSEMTALQYKKKIQQDERNAEARRREAEEKKLRDLENEKKEKLKREKQLQVGKKVRDQIQDLRKDIKEPSTDHEKAKKLVDAYLATEKAGYAPLHDARGNNTDVMKQFSMTDEEKAQERRIFAGNVISEMLDAENTPERNTSKDFKVHELVNGGKLKQLAEVIMTFSKFEEVIAANHPNTKYGIDMLIDGTKTMVHRNANDVLRDMNESIKLAEEEEKKQPRADEQPKVEETKDKEQSKKEEVNGLKPQVEQKTEEAQKAEEAKKPEETDKTEEDQKIEEENKTEKKVEEEPKPEEGKEQKPAEEKEPEKEQKPEEKNNTEEEKKTDAEPNKPVEDQKIEDEKQPEKKTEEKSIEVKTEEVKEEKDKKEADKKIKEDPENVPNPENQEVELKDEKQSENEKKLENEKNADNNKSVDEKKSVEENKPADMNKSAEEKKTTDENNSKDENKPAEEKKSDASIPGMETLWNETREEHENMPEYAEVLAEKKEIEHKEGPLAKTPEKYGLLNFLIQWFKRLFQSDKKADKEHLPTPSKTVQYLDQTLDKKYPNANVTSADIWNKEMLGKEYPDKSSQKKSTETSLKREENVLKEAKKDDQAKTVKQEDVPVASKKEKGTGTAESQKKAVIPSISTTVKEQKQTVAPSDKDGLYSLKLNRDYSEALGISEGWELFGNKKEIYAKSTEQMQVYLDKNGITIPPRKKEQKISKHDSGLKANKMNLQELVQEEKKNGKEEENFRKFAKSTDSKVRSEMRKQNAEEEFFQNYQTYCGNDENKIAKLNSNNISVLQKLAGSENNIDLMHYLNHRIQGLKKIESCAKKASANPQSRMDGTQKIGKDKVELEGVPTKRVQTTEHGCWAVALSNMLAYRGVYLEQAAIRTFRPDVNSYSAEDIADANKDRSQCIAQYSDLVQKVLPNTSVNHAECVVDQANTEAEAKTQIKQKLSSVIERGLKQDNGPVALLTGNHYLTVYKMEGDKVFVQDSMDSANPTRAMSLDTLADSCSTGSIKNGSGNDIKRYSFSADWLQDIEVNKEGKPILKGELEQFADTYQQGNTKEQGNVFIGSGFNSDNYHGCQFETKDGITITSVLPTNFKNYMKLTKDSIKNVQRDIAKDVKKAQADGLRRTKSFSKA